MGPRVALVLRQLWDSALLEQWVAAIVTPSLRRAHMGMAGPHDMGAEFIRRVLQRVP